jgi:hypothetical protein
VTIDYLGQLHEAVTRLAAQEGFSAKVATLREELAASEEPSFVWTTVPLGELGVELPEPIESCWIFHLRADVPSGCHYHPNSIQHMAVVGGHGRSRVGGVEGETVAFGSAGRSAEDQWIIIGQGVDHEFFPEGEPMTVVSFHTCREDELEEIECGSGSSRLYEGGTR